MRNQKRKGLPNLRTLSRDQLIDLKDQLTTDLQMIKLQITTAQTKAHETGEYAGSEWWYKVNRAKIVVGSHVRKVERVLSRLKEESGSKRLSDHFVQAAKFHLNEDTFDMLMEDAGARMESAKVK